MATNNEDTIVVGPVNGAPKNNQVPPRPAVPPRPTPQARPNAQARPATPPRPAFQPTSGDDGQTWKRIVIGGVAGIMFGSVSAVGATAAYHHFSGNGDEVEPEVQPETEDVSVPDEGHYMLDNGMMVAEVSDSMSFNEAFAAARAEVGPGGAFVWHGNVYATYVENEWNSMSPSERREFTHQSLSALNSENSHYTPDDHVDIVYHNDVHIHHVPAEPADNDDVVINDPGNADEDVEIVGVLPGEETGSPENGDGVYVINMDDGEEPMISDPANDGGFDDGLIVDNTLPGVDDGSMPDYINDAGDAILV